MTIITDTATPITRLGGRTALQNAFIRVDVDNVILPDGRTGEYSVITGGTGLGALTIPLVTAAGGHFFGFINQYRYPVKTTLLEFPAGGTDSFSAAEAGRELFEETGLTLTDATFLGTTYPDPLLNCEVAVWLSRQPEEALAVTHREEESGGVLLWYSHEEVREMIRCGLIRSGITLSALMMLEVSGLLTGPGGVRD
ncbi:NUDIX hydrolase (plasmid) [Pseudarthrobacter chlorophenolicus A6]|uniref:NUDIX hydrolase n=1 Tax=Pseudarthrobacter chlorophenolicus (strain ATCC 700700 / DSM 12829 / CIP 107037 / JCM 12360 / KCTC 9906 / NCIMB 13794 / A6) TaxID=452863 RepID=B8HHM5_PSECP|nr:NUDIX hydrolase [Pseudarthrobacter chlorophenolicus]ACL41922.1 NUDIX hydrolase [Pseudarthrobacter chlorophenolicus A6]SDQ18719.1 ADP-ribose pyrophosphatase [Pseudarthrobacter chlorophenolicus]